MFWERVYKWRGQLLLSRAIMAIVLKMGTTMSLQNFDYNEHKSGGSSDSCLEYCVCVVLVVIGIRVIYSLFEREEPPPERNPVLEAEIERVRDEGRRFKLVLAGREVGVRGAAYIVPLARERGLRWSVVERRWSAGPDDEGKFIRDEETGEEMAMSEARKKLIERCACRY